MIRVLPSITTHQTTNSSWRSKIAEIRTLGLRQVGLFVTGLSPEARTECFGVLEALLKTHNFSIPFVHAVTSMREDEFRYLQKVFNTERFNLHPLDEYPLLHPLSEEVRSRIYIENSRSFRPLKAADLEGFGGICFDLSHLEDAARGAADVFRNNIELTEHFEVGANHISAVGAINQGGNWSKHVAESHDEFSYLQGIPSSAVSSLCAVELENSLTEQIAFIASIRSNLGVGPESVKRLAA